MEKLSELFGSMVFNETVMRERLPQETFNTLKRTMDQGIPLEEGVANIVANAMKDWAVEKGATHFTHWFQPMTGIQLSLRRYPSNLRSPGLHCMGPHFTGFY